LFIAERFAMTQGSIGSRVVFKLREIRGYYSCLCRSALMCRRCINKHSPYNRVLSPHGRAPTTPTTKPRFTKKTKKNSASIS
jgi:hypothetical protein